MITGSQMRAARALLGIDQKTLAGLAELSVPTIQRSNSPVSNSLEKEPPARQADAACG